MVEIWDTIQKIFNVVMALGQKIWAFFTTPLYATIREIDLPWWLDWFERGVNWLCGPSGLIPNATFLSFLPYVIGLILIVKIIMLFVGRG